MPTRPDLRDITTGVKDALADCDRDTLLDILTFVVKEYVVDGPPPMLMHQTESIADLGRLSFAQLMVALQTRLELPELGLFAVDGEQVSVRIGGVMQPLARGAAATAAASAAELPRPSAGVRVVETATRPAPSAAPVAPMASTVTERAAPPPARGLSLRGRPAGAMIGDPNDAPPATPPAPATPAPAATPERREDTPGSGDDASARFSLLELD
ncbi:MAG: hypothetical protein IPL61_01710 [Myxococcales bacterium]|nr:hypothetical protein [Myxococcales bacterium]